MSAIIEKKRGEHSLPKLLDWPIPIAALILAGSHLAASLGIWSAHDAVLWMSISIYLLFVSASYFGSLLVPQSNA